MRTLIKVPICFIMLASLAVAQSSKPTVAILDFEGQGVDAGDVQTLTERMRTEIGNTNAIRLIERKAVEKIMAEQGFQQSGCTSDECAAEVGAMLGVEFMISGAIGKLGDTYTIDAKMFSVATGAAESMKSITYSGKVDGLIVEIELLAWDILGLDAPRSLRKKRNKDYSQVAGGKDGPNWLLWGGLLLAVGGGAAIAMGSGGDTGAAASIGEPPATPEVP